jgi:hypothetical protein
MRDCGSGSSSTLGAVFVKPSSAGFCIRKQDEIISA